MKRLGSCECLGFTGFKAYLLSNFLRLEGVGFSELLSGGGALALAGFEPRFTIIVSKPEIKGFVDIGLHVGHCPSMECT